MWLVACLDADPRTVAGAFDGAARAVESDDPEQLFRMVDQRAQHAMMAIVKARNAARLLIETDYPAEERARAVAALGDAAQVQKAAMLFARRCPATCRAEFGRRLGAPLEVTPAGEVLSVRTARGATLQVYLGTHGWYGLVFETDALLRERNQASRELRQIEENAAIYRRREELSAGNREESAQSVSGKSGHTSSAPGSAPADAASK